MRGSANSLTADRDAISCFLVRYCQPVRPQLIVALLQTPSEAYVDALTTVVSPLITSLVWRSVGARARDLYVV